MSIVESEKLEKNQKGKNMHLLICLSEILYSTLELVQDR